MRSMRSSEELVNLRGGLFEIVAAYRAAGFVPSRPASPANYIHSWPGRGWDRHHPGPVEDAKRAHGWAGFIGAYRTPPRKRFSALPRAGTTRRRCSILSLVSNHCEAPSARLILRMSASDPLAWKSLAPLVGANHFVGMRASTWLPWSLSSLKARRPSASRRFGAEHRSDGRPLPLL